MHDIQVLDEQTIDKIAAGEVVERPSSVVKELAENAIDAKATAITIEIKDGGISFIRITDNGEGIPKDQVPSAFLRHATSKIKSVEDLLTISSLGFRGEALSSIAAVSQAELITKTASELTGTRYVIEGSKEKSIEDIGAPQGTTFLIRNLFYNTPARQKFLKSAQTEASYISTLTERLALSHPDISFQLIINNQPRLHTNGNTRVKDIIYHIFGRDIAAGVLPVQSETELLSVNGFIGQPFISRGNRNFEIYFINGRYIKSALITKCIEDAYKPFLMKHQYPFTVLQISLDSDLIDVNVHPSKMEIRFQQSETIYRELTAVLQNVLKNADMIQNVSADKETKKQKSGIKTASRRPEPFEKNRLAALAASLKADSPYERKYTRTSVSENQLKSEMDTGRFPETDNKLPQIEEDTASRTESKMHAGHPNGEMSKPAYGVSVQQSENYEGTKMPGTINETSALQAGGHTHKNLFGNLPEVSMQQAETNTDTDLPAVSHASAIQQAQAEPPFMSDASLADVSDNQPYTQTYEQLSIAETSYYHADFIKEAKRCNYTLIGQVFDTYWLVQSGQELFIIDQHAAHEKVLYEKMMARLKDQEFTSQQISPPVIVTMTMQEQELFHRFEEQFSKIGFEVNSFGGKEYAVCAVPANLYELNQKELFLEMLDGLSHDTGKQTPDMILEKIASMSCKAAVKGKQRLSEAEARSLLSDLLELENPYHCPHGRPVIIAMTKTEIERKFKRIV